MKLLLFISLIVFSFSSFGQSAALGTMSTKPDFFLVINDQEIKLDSITISQIDAKWIQELVIVKDKDYQGIGHAPITAILIHPIYRHKRKFLNLIDLKSVKSEVGSR